jgi:hypothetical protein
MANCPLAFASSIICLKFADHRDVMRAYFADASGLVKPRTKPIRSQKEKLSQACG